LRLSQAPQINLSKPGQVERGHEVLKLGRRSVERLLELVVLDVARARRLGVSADTSARI
jgi:hypothetical protein